MTFSLIILGSLIATVTEAVSFKIDDNLTIPFITAWLMSIASCFSTFT
jgi:dolichol kinase